MQLYHHPLSLNSQKVRIALEEKGVDYVLNSVNAIKARNLDPEFFRLYANGTIPVLVNGNRVICESLPIIQYIDCINQPLGSDKVNREKVQEWLQRIDEWDSKLFTLCQYSESILQFHSRFRRRVVIDRMAKNPDLASKYHSKLNKMHTLMENLKDKESVQANLEHLNRILDAAEADLTNSKYLAGQDFSMADASCIAVLARIEMLKHGKSLIIPRLRLTEYWSRMKERPSYKVAIGSYMTKLGRMKFIVPSVCNVGLRRLFGKY